MMCHVFFWGGQITRLTWFTRFDPVEEPKEQIFSVECSTKMFKEITSQTNEMEVTENELEGNNGKACHYRKGESVSCLALHFSI